MWRSSTTKIVHDGFRSYLDAMIAQNELAQAADASAAISTTRVRSENEARPVEGG